MLIAKVVPKDSFYWFGTLRSTTWQRCPTTRRGSSRRSTVCCDRRMAKLVMIVDHDPRVSLTSPAFGQSPGPWVNKDDKANTTVHYNYNSSLCMFNVHFLRFCYNNWQLPYITIGSNVWGNLQSYGKLGSRNFHLRRSNLYDCPSMVMRLLYSY